MDTSLKSKSGYKTNVIVESLREQILSGVLRPGEKVMSARELGCHFQVSLVTANKALLGLEAENLIVRNERSGSFVKANHNNKQYKVGFVDNYKLFMQEIQGSCGLYRDTCIRLLQENNCSVHLLNEDEVASAVLDGQLDGLICYNLYWNDDLMLEMKKTGIPIVLGRVDYVLNTPFHQVLPDIYGAVYEVFRRIERKRFDGLIIVYEDHRNCCFRRDLALSMAQHAGFEKHDIELVKVAHVEVEMNYPIWQGISKRSAKKFIYACGDNMAAAMIRIFREAKLEFGTEIQLASCGNLEDCGYQPFDEPTITSAGSHYELYGRTAVNLLLRMIESPEENKLSHVIRIPAVYRQRKTAFEGRK